MSVTLLADPRDASAPAIASLWMHAPRRSWFGDLALLVFLLAQCFDGVLTYVGIQIYGPGVEANPIISALMLQLGHGTALISAKVVAAVLGIALHLREVHAAVALLAGFYLTVAIIPWTVLLYFW